MMKKPLRIWRGWPHTKRLVSLTSDHTLRSRVIGNDHARFWIGGGGSNPFADHTGVFHHYFNSRRALLEAFIEHIRQESEKPLLPIIHDPNLSAIEKLQGFFDTLDRLRIARKADVVKLVHVWYTDDNAIIRRRVDEVILQQRVPLLTEW